MGATQADAVPAEGTVLLTLGRWWRLIAAMTVGGALLGLVIGLRAPASSEVLLLVSLPSTDSALVAQAVETAIFELESPRVFDAAAAARGGAAEDLTRRTVVARQPASPVISVVVTAPTAEQASDDASAIAVAAIAARAAAQQRTLDQIREGGNTVLKGGSLDDPVAEQSRVPALGAGVATQQGQALAQASLVARGGTTESTVSARVLTLVGGAAGLLLGTALALGLGARRGRLRSLKDVELLYPGHEIAPSSDADIVVGRIADHRNSLLLVAAVGDSSHLLSQVGRDATAGLRDAAWRPKLTNLLDTGAPRDARPGAGLLNAQSRADTLNGVGVDVAVVLCAATRQVLERVAGQHDAATFLVASLSHTTHAELAGALRALTDAPAAILIGP